MYRVAEHRSSDPARFWGAIRTAVAGPLPPLVVERSPWP